VIFRSAHGKRLDVVIASDSREVVPQSGLSGRGNELLALFCAEDNVKNRANVAVRHRCRYRNGDEQTFSVTRVTCRQVELCRPRGARDNETCREPTASAVG